jgi:ubiquinone/menaquinone biosynthesis C-methylase UbiE
MIGAKAGDRVLVIGVIGATDPGLAADTALVTGLNGSTVVVDPAPDMVARIDKAAGRAGALVETAVAPVTATPFDTDAFDIVVVQSGLAVSGDEREQTLMEASRVARAGGRVIVIERRRKPGVLGAVMGAGSPSIAGEDVCQLMTRAGLRGARVLADIGGALFVEAIKPRLPRAGTD